MFKIFLPWITLLFVQTSQAGIGQLFKDEDGRTNWQHIANWSSGILILLLSITAIILFFIHRRARRANRALTDIRGQLENRVRERTATLDESNRLLSESNRLLLSEIAEHKDTTGKLVSSEAYIRDILESMPLMLIGLNRDFMITQWNRLAVNITGIDDRQALGRNLWEAYPTITLSPEQIKNVFETKKPKTIKHSQRGQYYFDITVYPLQSEGETDLVILVDDVTQRILAENMLIQRDKMSSMGELASTMAHDINVPLKAIQKNLAVVVSDLDTIDLVNSEDKSGWHTLLDDSVELGKQASNVISNLLAFANQSNDEKAPEGLPAVVDHAIELAADVISDESGLYFRDIKVEKQYQDNLPPIPIVASELQQVFLSLFRHACHSLGKAMTKTGPAFEPKVHIEISEYYEAIWVKVQHNGTGLTAEEQQSIFEPFFSSSDDSQLYDAAKRLSFSYFIVTEHHRGQMAVTSDPEVGTTFHIQFQLG